jgi:acetyl-CoA acetyltransferase
MTTTRQGSNPGVAIVGLGITEMGRIYGRSPLDLAREAGELALADAGMPREAVDGLLASAGKSGGVGIPLHAELGLRNLGLLTEMSAFGSTAGQMIGYAAMAIQTGLASAVLCAFGDAPLETGRRTGEAYYTPSALVGFEGITSDAGLVGATPLYALAARRHMARYGTTSEQLGSVAVQTRGWAAQNPRAQMRAEMTMADHQASRMIADPLHLLDCCIVSNGGVAVLLTSAERAADWRQVPLYVLGFGQGHPSWPLARGSEWGLRTGAAISGPKALSMAKLKVDDIDVCEIYDCYTYTTLVTLEDYGFCPKGEGGSFVADGNLGPDGRIPTNTGGGQLSGYYMWGMTPLSEGIIQARGDGGDRQVPNHDAVLISGNGGILEYHSTLVLSQHAST